MLCSYVIRWYTLPPILRLMSYYLVKKLNLPAIFLKEPEPQYNYDNYIFYLKRITRETHRITRQYLIREKEQTIIFILVLLGLTIYKYYM